MDLTKFLNLAETFTLVTEGSVNFLILMYQFFAIQSSGYTRFDNVSPKKAVFSTYKYSKFYRMDIFLCYSVF